MLYQRQPAGRGPSPVCSSLLIVSMLAWMQGAAAGTFKTIYRFTSSLDAGESSAGLAVDAQGRLYGTSLDGGAFQAGAIFRLTPPVGMGASWTEEIIHNFSFDGSDGDFPSGPVLLDQAGNVFGGTIGGGSYNAGVVYRLDVSNAWAETILHAFSVYPDVMSPRAGVILGRDGLLYGTAMGGLNRRGGVFDVSPDGDTVAYSVAHSFGARANYASGSNGLAQNEAGQLFGTAYYGGAFSYGIAYSLTQVRNGKWQLRDLHDFGMPSSGDVASPTNALLIGRGKLYPGIFGCDAGGTTGRGAVFRLDPPAGGVGQWTETILYQFGTQPNDPDARENGQCLLAQGHAGTLYGLTAGGGARCGGNHCGGALFALTPSAARGAGWTETVLHSFGGFDGGLHPFGAPLFLKGRLYGTTENGFPHSQAANGTVWEYIP